MMKTRLHKLLAFLCACLAPMLALAADPGIATSLNGRPNWQQFDPNTLSTNGGSVAVKAGVFQIGSATLTNWSGLATNAIPRALTNAGNLTGSLIYNSNAPVWSLKSLSVGSRMTLTDQGTNIALDATGGGTVTSVALTAPVEFSVGGSPITTAGTLALTWGNASGRKFIASPSDGSSGAYAGRAIIAADIPALSYESPLTFSAPLSRSGNTISIPNSTGSVDGYLSSANFTIFNAKEPAITAGTTAQYWRGDKTWQTLNSSAVGLGNVENTALSTWSGSANLTTVGALSSGSIAAGFTAIANARLANSTMTIGGASTALGGTVTASTILDSIGSTRGSVLYRGASGWTILAPGTSGYFLQSAGAGADPIYAAGNSGTVTSFSSGDLSPLFTTSVANSTTTPALTYSLTSQNANMVFAGPVSGGAGAPTVRALVAADIPNLDAGKITSGTLSDSRLSANVTLIDGSRAFTAEVQGVTPATDNGLATKIYVDTVAAGLSPKLAVQAATAAALPANIYNNGASGVGATLTGVSVGVLTVDGYTVALNDRVLVKDEVTASHNGIYKVTTLGSSLVVYVLTRTTDDDQATEIPGASTFVENGTLNVDLGFVCITVSPVTMGTTAINWTQFTGAGEITVDASLTKSGNQLGRSALTGDVTASAGANATTLATVATAGTTGSSTAIPVVTINAKGLTTSITTAAVVAPAGTLTGTTLAAGVLASSLTSVGTLTGGATGAGFTIALASSTITGSLPIANGGTSATTGYAAKDNLSLKGADIASGTTTDLSAATGDFVFVTGTTTITGLGTATAGVERTVKFTGALTLTHDATALILPGNANITTAASDRAVFRSLGSGNWICTSYVRATAPPVSGSNTGDQTITLTGNVTGSGTGSFATTIANGVVTEAMQTLADNTTGNASTSAHGYLKKLSGSAADYQDGSGNWSVPAGSGGTPALSAITAATAANTITNKDYAQVWKWSGTNSANLFRITESAASTATNPLVRIDTIAASDAMPLMVSALGADAFAVKTNGFLHHVPIALPGTLENGDFGFDSSQNAFTTRVLAMTLPVPVVLFSGTATKSCTNTTTATSLIPTSGYGSATIKANYLKVGKVIRVTLRGGSDNNNGGTLGLTNKFGSTVIASTSQNPSANPITVKAFVIQYEITCRTTGASGTVVCVGGYNVQSTTTTLFTMPLFTAEPGAITVDTTVDSAIDTIWAFGTQGTSNYIYVQYCLIEALN